MFSTQRNTRQLCLTNTQGAHASEICFLRSICFLAVFLPCKRPLYPGKIAISTVVQAREWSSHPSSGLRRRALVLSSKFFPPPNEQQWLIRAYPSPGRGYMHELVVHCEWVGNARQYWRVTWLNGVGGYRWPKKMTGLVRCNGHYVLRWSARFT